MRLVSLCPSITESLIALGAREKLVGVTRYCIHPHEAVRSLSRVGGTKDPDLPKIRALAPDLIFLNSEENRAQDIETLSAEFAVDVSCPKRVSEVPALLRRFGLLMGTPEAGESWAARIEQAGEANSAPVSFRYVYLIWKDPWMTIGCETYIADLLGFAGGVNAFGSGGTRGDYPVVAESEIEAARPDVLLLPDEPYRFRENHQQYWSQKIPAARVLLLSGDDFCWHGVRTLRGIEAAHELSASLARAGTST